MVKDGLKFLLPPLVMAAIAASVGWYAVAAACFLLGAAIAYFFRDPERASPADPDTVLSPADGRVMAIVDEPFENERGQRISIFLAVWNVHVNRAPMAGTVERVEYRRGKFHVASRAVASVANEQNIIHLRTDRGTIVFKQIAGLIARRVVCWKSPGDRLAAGERIGLIRFGSRMDVWLPCGAKILVKRGDHVAGGVSVLATWR
jgi:phosphatidylserine decarboxylase